MSQSWGRLRHRLLAVVLACVPYGAAAAPADEVRSLMEAGRAAQAYELGRKSPEAFGDPAFDFYFGIAAIDSGHAGEGVLALERYLLVFPDNGSARLQLARGFFLLGEDGRAREEFEALRALNPPSDVAATIERFIDAIRLRETRYTTSTGIYVEAGVGWDSNINAGVSNPNISLPFLGPVVVGPAGTKNADTFGHLGIGGYVSHPISPGIALFATGAAEWKRHNDDREFDQGTYNLSGGVSVLREKNLFRLGVLHGLVTLEHDRFREANGVSGEWQHQLDERQALSVGAQAGRLRYPGLNSPRDADFIYGNLGYRRLFDHRMQPILTATVNFGREDTIAASREDLSRHFYGGRLGVNLTPAAKWGASFGLSYQESDYQGPDVILGVARRDKYYAADAAVSYLLTRNLSVRGEAMWSKNRSNIELFTYPREIYAVKLRYEFK